MSWGAVGQWLIAGTGAAGAVSGLAMAWQARATKRRIDAETRKLSTDQAAVVNAMALSLLEPMQRRIEELTGEVETLERKTKALTDRLELAQRLLTEHGVPFPPVPEV